MGRVTVLIVDDHIVVREGLRAMLASDERIEVVGDAGDGHEALERVAELRPDVVLMDALMPGMDALEATRRIADEHPDSAVLILTDHEDDDLVVTAVCEGAVGYVLKGTTRELLGLAVVAAANGAVLIKPSLVRRAFGSLTEQLLQPDASLSESGQTKELTERDLAVLKLIAEGYTNKQIAEALGIAEVTVKKHVHVIISKLGVSDRTQAAITALRMGLV